MTLPDVNVARGVWRRILLPPLAFQAVVIGGGYATGRELVEFFGRGSPMAGLAGMSLVAIAWSLICAAAFAHACAVQAFDYRSFFKSLLGRAWILFEIAYVLLLVLILSVLGAATGQISAQLLHLAPLVGTTAFVLLTVLITWRGSRAVELMFSAWSPLIYVAFGALFAYSASRDHAAIHEALKIHDEDGLNWILPALTYASYNLAVLPAVLPTIRNVGSRAHAIVAGLLVGPLAMIPAVLLYLALLTEHSRIVTAPVPIMLLIGRPEFPLALAIALGIVIFGTLVQTAVGVLHSINERLAPGGDGRRETLRRGIVALVMAGGSVFLAERAGLITLIAKGYGTLAWIIFSLTVVPLAWVTLRLVWRRTVAAG